MRLFIAINFEDKIAEELTDLQEELRVCGVEGNYTRRENLHLTLAFIGDYGNPDEVLDAMREVPFRQLTVEYEGLQHYRDMYFARFKSNPGIESYVRRLRRALAEHDIPYDSGLCEINVNRVSLMLSQRGRHGMIYTELDGIDGQEDWQTRRNI